MTALFSGVAQSQNGEMLNNLSGLQWKNRIVVLNEIDNKTEALRLLEQQHGDIK